MKFTAVGDVNGIKVAAVGQTQAQAAAFLDAAVRDVRENRPRLGWLAKPKGTAGAGHCIIRIDRDAGTVGLQDLGTRPWKDCEYVL